MHCSRKNVLNARNFNNDQNYLYLLCLASGSATSNEYDLLSIREALARFEPFFFGRIFEIKDENWKKFQDLFSNLPNFVKNKKKSWSLRVHAILT